MRQTSCPTQQTTRGRLRPHFAAVASALAFLPAPALLAQEVISASPDITIALGAGNVVTSDDSVAVDNQLGLVALQGLAAGSLPPQVDVTGYADAGAGSVYFSIDTTADLGGGIVARPEDVVSWNGGSHAIVFDGSVAGVPAGVQIDAIDLTPGNGLLLSFDTDVALPGGVTAADEDLVRYAAGAFTLVFDGSTAGIDRALDVDGAQNIGGGYLVSFDTSGTVGAVTFADEDILRVVAGNWTMSFDASTSDADWGAADMDAMQVPEPGGLAILVSGVLGVMGFSALRVRRDRAAESDGSSRPAR